MHNAPSARRVQSLAFLSSPSATSFWTTQHGTRGSGSDTGVGSSLTGTRQSLMRLNTGLTGDPLNSLRGPGDDAASKGLPAKANELNSDASGMRDAANHSLLNDSASNAPHSIMRDSNLLAPDTLAPDACDSPKVAEAATENRREQHTGVDCSVAPRPVGDRASLPVSSSEIQGLLKMARLNAAPMGAGLVALGAYGARNAASAAFGAKELGQLSLSAFITVMVTSSSMLVNDYHDWKLGVDNAQTKPGRPLVTGQVRPETVKNALKSAYVAQMALLCLVDRAPTRLWILSNTLLTHFYSQHLKPITGVKNMTCAAIVAMAMGLGALAIGGLRALGSVWRPMAVVAGTICHREMVMDIKDADGDGQSGVKTVPVVLGKKRGLQVAMAPLAMALAAASSAPNKSARLVASAAMLTQAGFALDSGRRGFNKASLGRAIELAPAWLLAALVSLTVK